VGEFLCTAKEEGEPSSGVRPWFGLVYVLRGENFLGKKAFPRTPFKELTMGVFFYF
jgi:hypothetical protein